MNKYFTRQRIFAIEVIFHSCIGKRVPSAGYCPHLLMDNDTAKEYLGVEFYDIEVDSVNQVGYAMCRCLYEKEGVDYGKIQPGKTFSVMEGQHIVGTGKIINL